MVQEIVFMGKEMLFLVVNVIFYIFGRNNELFGEDLNFMVKFF